MTRRILYVQFTDPAVYPPVEHSSRLFAERGWEVVLLGIRTVSKLNLQLPAHPRIRIKKIGFVRPGRWQKLHYAFFFSLTLFWTWRLKPSWIYASDPLTCPIICALRKLANVKVVYHEHDSPVETEGESWFAKMILNCRRRVGREAEICVLPQQDRLLCFLKSTERKKQAFYVWNCPRTDEIPSDVVADDDSFILYYHGNISPALLPPSVLVALNRFDGRIRLRVAGYETAGCEGYIQKCRKEASSVPIEFIGSMGRAALFRAASTAHMGLCMMPRAPANINFRHMVGASNKAFDYMACRLPLLVSNLPDWISTFVEPGYARACDPNDPDSIESELRWYLEHPYERREMGTRAQAKIQAEWNYDKMFADVIAHVEGRHV